MSLAKALRRERLGCGHYIMGQHGEEAKDLKSAEGSSALTATATDEILALLSHHFGYLLFSIL